MLKITCGEAIDVCKSINSIIWSEDNSDISETLGKDLLSDVEKIIYRIRDKYVQNKNNS